LSIRVPFLEGFEGLADVDADEKMPPVELRFAPMEGGLAELDL